MSEMRDTAIQQGNDKLREECEMFIRLLTSAEVAGAAVGGCQLLVQYHRRRQLHPPQLHIGYTDGP